MPGEPDAICPECSHIAFYDPYFKAVRCTQCGWMERVKPTNADRIRSMSDEELAAYIYEMQKQMCDRFAEIIKYPEPLKFDESAPDLLDWLRQSAT